MYLVMIIQFHVVLARADSLSHIETSMSRRGERERSIYLFFYLSNRLSNLNLT